MGKRAFHGDRYLVPTLFALTASAAGCGGGETPTVGMASMKSAYLAIDHGAANTDLTFIAEITLPGGPSCPPPLAADFAITVNGTPMRLSLPDDSDAITISCTIHQLEGFVMLPVTGGPLDVELTQGNREASLVIAESAFPAIGPVTLSRTAVPVGEFFSVNVAVPDADQFERQQLANPSFWTASLCVSPGCVPGQGWIGLLLENARARDGGLEFDVAVPDTVQKGEWQLGLHLFKPTFAPTITKCSGMPSCLAYNNSDQNWDFGPFALDVL